MNLSAETVGGRCVLTRGGGIYAFRSNGKYEARTVYGRMHRGDWAIAFGKVIRVTFRNGNTADFSSSKVDGETRLGIVSGRSPTQYVITDIQPESSASCAVENWAIIRRDRGNKR